MSTSLLHFGMLLHALFLCSNQICCELMSAIVWAFTEKHCFDLVLPNF